MRTSRSTLRSPRRSLTAAAAAATAALLAGTGAASADVRGGEPVLPACTLVQVTGAVAASPTVVQGGGTTNLGWQVTAPASCPGLTITLNGASVAKSGQKEFHPLTTTTYNLTAKLGASSKPLGATTVAVDGQHEVDVKLSSFSAAQAGEGAFGGGDEPWLMVFPVFVDGTTVDAADLPGSWTTVFGTPYAHGNLGNVSVGSGTTVAVPQGTGTFLDNVMTPVRALSPSLGRQAAVAGVVVVALEQDGSSDASAGVARSMAQAGIKAKLDDLVATMPVPAPGNLAAYRAELKSRVLDAVSKDSLVGSGLFAGVNADDYIGAGFASSSLAELEAAGPAGRQIALSFQQPGTSYAVTGTISAS
ncbi:hypothetical protein [Motilibacter deserti]|uniref:Uncharacterized protein n=1 Tax=Motilibacter deserti TaxID=2714956 RepID=A0ABX0H1H1_9ACTN|nr:hypothetical protein [Motilibacter deserti]NHC15674.1 hypothetical protein [Motilibacter deserti]